MSITIILLAVVVIIILWAIGSYNHFVTLKNRAKEAFADVDVQLKRRYDLIPNLVNTVKGYATHESTAFENVSKARAAAMSANTSGGSLADKGAAEQNLTTAVHGIFAIAEAYPELKANQNFLQLQGELSDTENKIQASRRFYDTTVRDLNTGLESFPGNFIGKMGNFQKMDLFSTTSDAERNPVEVKF